MLEIVKVIEENGNTPDDMVKAYVEVLLLTNPHTYALVKNATSQDISKLNELYQVDISGAAAALNNQDSNNDGTVNNLPMLAMLEAKNSNDTLFFKAIAAFNEYKEYMAEIGRNYSGLVGPKYEIAKAKVNLVVKYFESSK